MATDTALRKSVQAVDAEIGLRVRRRRIECGLSQEKLGDALGLTFQQIQKYEKGANRISGSRMVQIAQALKTDVSWFFNGANAQAVNGKLRRPENAESEEFLATRDGQRLLQAMRTLKVRHRRAVLALIEELAGIEANER